MTVKKCIFTRKREARACKVVVLQILNLACSRLSGSGEKARDTYIRVRAFSIDLFTDTAAILNLLDLRSIMGCSGGTRAVFTRAFRVKRELLGKKAFIITSKHRHNDLFFPLQSFSRKT